MGKDTFTVRFYRQIRAEREVVLDTLWTLKNTAGCFGKITAGIEVPGDF
jgi:hypothetical protein